MLLLLLFGGVGLVIAGLGVPLVMRRSPPNAIYGLRTTATMRDEALWYGANARSGWYSIFAGGLVALVALGLFLADVPRDAAGGVNIAVLVLAVGAMCARSLRCAADLAGPNS